MMTQRAAKALTPVLRAARAAAIGLGALTLAAGCVGEMINHPAVEIAQLKLTADDVGSLVLDECVKANGAGACHTYPNPSACDDLLVSVRGDGSTIGQCNVKGVMQIIRGMAEGVPIICHFDSDQGCVSCVDVFGGFAVGTCDEGSDPSDKESLHSSSVGAASSSTAPPTAEEAACTQKAQQDFIDRINKLFKDEGLKITYKPDLNKLKPVGPGVVTGALCSGLGLAGDPNKPEVPIPATVWGTIDPFVKECDLKSMAQGHCYCAQVPLLGSFCRCGRFMGALLAETCHDIPPECTPGDFARAIFPLWGDATLWLKAFYILPTKGPDDITCEWSPLVLDLNNDGVKLSGASGGVTFDLTGAGPLRTAWTRGADDVLLAMDRDGNGTIDSGAELFGEGTLVDGRMAADGFRALAALDRPEQGGNNNGLVDPGDLMFDQLVLWRDADHNGRSEAGELGSLASAGVIGLEVTGSATAAIIDAHGNDLSLRARFLRADGSAGLLVDAYFVTAEP